MPPTSLFWLALCSTVALIGATLVTGHRHRRRLHLWLGPLTLIMVAVTIVLTEQLVSRYEFPAATRDIHLPIAKAAGLLAIPVALTGAWLWRSGRARRWHRVAVWLWLASVLAAAATGFWMFAHGTLRTG